MRIKILITLILLCSLHFSVFAQESNLKSFFIKGDNDLTYLGYVEPISEQATSNARILVFPVVSVKQNDVILEDETGRNLMTLEGSDISKLQGRVSAKIDINDLANNKKVLNKLILSFHPDIVADSRGIIEKPTKKEFPCPEIQGNNVVTQSYINNLMANYVDEYYQEMALYQQQVYKVNTKLAKYNVVPVFPKALKFTLLVNGNQISSTTFSVSSSINSGSIFDIPIPKNLSESNYRNLLDGEFLIQTEFQFLSSKFQSASASINLKGHTTYFADAFKQAISRASSTTSGFLFWQSTQKRISEFIQERSNESLSSQSVQNYEYRLYDVENQNLIQQVENFIFPKTTIDEMILNHRQSAQQARNLDNEELAKVHEQYASLLESNRNNLGNTNQVDVAKALESLAQEDLIGFLANGFAFGISESNNSFTYRKLVSRNFTQNEIKTFNALIFKSLYENHLISQRPKK